MTSTTVDARAAAADALADALPSAAEAGVPASWSVRDLQAGLGEAEIPTDELDPFRGVVECPDAFLAFVEGGPWAERKFNGIEPSPAGVLIVRVQLVRENSAAWERRQDLLAECEAASVDAFVEREPSLVAVGPAEDVGAQRLAVFSSATADAPFPSQVVYLTAHLDGVTAAAAVFGLNEAEPFDDTAAPLLGQVLAEARR